jgi:hypothetical protein
MFDKLTHDLLRPIINNDRTLQAVNRRRYGRRMPRICPAVVLAVALALTSACAGGDRPAASRTEGATAESLAASAEACFARLDRIDGLKYRRLDRYREGVCGYEAGVLLVDIGVPISGLKAVSCPVAERLYRWLHDGVRPAARDIMGSDVSRIQSLGSYACRTRNNQSGAALSEHARANAIDIAAFTLSDGRTVKVAGGWRGAGDEQAFLRRVHRDGCQRFSIVIGPDADRFHQDHLHLDMGRGPYCR